MNKTDAFAHVTLAKVLGYRGLKKWMKNHGTSFKSGRMRQGFHKITVVSASEAFGMNYDEKEEFTLYFSPSGEPVSYLHLYNGVRKEGTL